MRKILIIREGALGDLILTFPVFLNLKNNNFSVSVAGKGIYKNFVEKYGSIEEFIPIDSSSFIFFFENEIEKLRNFLEKFDIIIAYCNEDDQIGKNLKNVFSKNLMFHPIKFQDLKIHITDYLNFPLKSFIYSDLVDKFRLNIEKKEEVFVIHPGSGSKCKNWKKENFLSIANELKNVIIILGPNEEDEYDFWKKNFKGKIVLNPELDEIIEIAKRTIVYIGNDSGITHLFSITGVKTIGIYGPTSPFIWGPKGENVKIVYKNVGCNPCDRERYIRCQKRNCLEEIKIEDVMKIIKNGRTGNI
jgi:ADP-heptose:LPS heptosyltransferase